MTTQSALVSSAMPFKATLFVKMLERLEHGSISLTLPNQESYCFEGKHQGIKADLQVKNLPTVRRENCTFFGTSFASVCLQLL